VRVQVAEMRVLKAVKGGIRDERIRKEIIRD
jgi:hypothetical protein